MNLIIGATILSPTLLMLTSAYGTARLLHDSVVAEDKVEWASEVMLDDTGLTDLTVAVVGVDEDGNEISSGDVARRLGNGLGKLVITVAAFARGRELIGNRTFEVPVPKLTPRLNPDGSASLVLAAGSQAATAPVMAGIVAGGAVTVADGIVSSTNFVVKMVGQGFDGGDTARVIMSGGHTVTKYAARELNRHFGTNHPKREWGRVLENLKDTFDIPNNRHNQKLHADGLVTDSETGKILGNLIDFMH